MVDAPNAPQDENLFVLNKAACYLGISTEVSICGLGPLCVPRVRRRWTAELVVRLGRLRAFVDKWVSLDATMSTKKNLHLQHHKNTTTKPIDSRNHFPKCTKSCSSITGGLWLSWKPNKKRLMYEGRYFTRNFENYKSESHPFWWLCHASICE